MQESSEVEGMSDVTTLNTRQGDDDEDGSVGHGLDLTHEYFPREHDRSSMPIPSPPAFLESQASEATPLLLSSMSQEEPAASSLHSQRSTGLTHRNFKGPMHPRSCTDVLFAVLLCLAWIGLLLLGVLAFSGAEVQSSWRYITTGVDYLGRGCGMVAWEGGAGKNNKFLYFPDVEKNPDFGVCIEACPKSRDILHVAVETVGKDILNVTFETYETTAHTYLCYPKDGTAPVTGQLMDTLGRFVGALEEAWLPLLICAGISMALSMFYLLLLKLCGGIVLALSIVLIQTSLFVGGYEFLKMANSPTHQDDPAMRSSLQMASIVAFCAGVVFFFTAVLMIRRFMLANVFILHASRALVQMKKLVVVPFMVSLVLMVVFFWAVVVTVCLFSSGETKTHEAILHAQHPLHVVVSIMTFQLNWTLRWMFFVHAFGIFWTFKFLMAIGELIVSTAVATWFFSHAQTLESITKRLTVDPVQHGIQTTMRYHIGTVACYSFVVPLVDSTRSCLAYFRENKDMTRRNQHPINPSNADIISHPNEKKNGACARFVTSLCCCCIWCFDGCLKYMCREAIYLTAINGSGFYRSAKLAHGLIELNRLRVGSLHMIGEAASFLGKLIVCVSSCFACWFLVSGVSSPILPLIATGILAYSVAHIFLSVFETTINTLLVCFLIDEDTQGYFAHPSLTKSVDDHLRPQWQSIL